MKEDNYDDLPLSLILKVSEINYILGCLSKQPYDQVYTLIPKIKKQGEDCFKELGEPPIVQPNA